MRTLALLAAALLTFGGLAGCVGDKEAAVNPNKANDGTNLPGGAETVTVLAALKSSISAEADAWLEPGTSFPVSAEAPANAQGNVTYTWAIGAMPGTEAGPVTTLDTGAIDPGASTTLTFSAAGVYQMHCHPHPYMLHNVTVVEGYTGASVTTVLIVDGADPGEYRFVPETIIVAPGTEVTYKNIGDQMHTATLSLSEPALKALPLTAASGEVALEGDGWVRLVAVMQDEGGRIGLATHAVYVKEIPANLKDSLTGSINVGTGSAPAQPPATPPGSGAVSKQVTLAHGGRAFLNVTIDDPTEELNQVSVHLRKNGETQDSMTLSAGTLASDAIVNEGQYVLEVIGERGVAIEFTVTIEVVYDLVPPAIEMKVEDDGHGGHAHH